MIGCILSVFRVSVISFCIQGSWRIKKKNYQEGRFVCPEAVILFVHLWTCMKILWTLTSVVVNRPADRSTEGHRDGAQSREDTLQNKILFKKKQKNFFFFFNLLTGSIFTMLHMLVTGMWSRLTKTGFFLYSLCSMRWRWEALTSLFFPMGENRF